MKILSKFIVILSITILSNMAWALDKNSPNWIDFDQALKIAKEKNKFVMVKLYADWCGPCKMMDQITFSDPKVIKIIDENFLAAKLNVESEKIINCDNWPRSIANCVAKNWELVGIPTISIIGPSGYNILNVSRFLDVEEMKLFLNNLLSDKNLLLEADKETSNHFKRLNENKKGVD